LAKTANVVVVTLNYRLGPLGHMAHRQLSLASQYQGSGNYAYMDQIQALKWVQRNIAAFGGNPGNVTLFGQSAGATSVWVQMASPLSKGLFHRAIVNSGIKETAKDQSVAEAIGREISQKLGCSKEDDELACMRRMSAREFFDKLPMTYKMPGSDKYGAIKDQWVLNGDPIRVMRRGEHNRVPIIQGNVQVELPRATDVDTASNLELALNMWYQNIAPNDEILLHYPASEYSSRNPFQAIFNAIEFDHRFFCPSRRILRALSSTQMDFIGRFFYTHALSDGSHVSLGAFHGLEVLFIFNTLASVQTDPTMDEVALVKTFQEAWSTFAKTGSPPAYWKKYDPQKDNYVVFDTVRSDDGGLPQKEGLRQKQCDFWDKLLPP
jgi:para-nitrobenzyl esterase